MSPTSEILEPTLCLKKRKKERKRKKRKERILMKY